MSKKDNRINFRAAPHTQEYLEARERGPRQQSSVINTTFDRLAYLLKTAEPDLTSAEWQLIYNTQSSAAPMPAAQTISGIVASVEDSIDLDGADSTYGVDGAALVAKLRSLDRVGRLAVVDKAERWCAKNG